MSFISNPIVSAGGGTPTGPAGGDLDGTYPDPLNCVVTRNVYAASGHIGTVKVGHKNLCPWPGQE